MNLPDFEIKIGGVEYTNSFPDDIRIDRTMLTEEFTTQGEKFAYWSFIAEKAKHLYLLSKFELEQLYAKVEHEKRMAAAAMKANDAKFKHTEKMCESEVITDPRYTKKKLQVLKAQELAGLAKSASDAISQRRDMLIQLGANDRIGHAPGRVMDTPNVAKTVIENNKNNNAAPKAASSRRRPKNT